MNHVDSHFLLLSVIELFLESTACPLFSMPIKIAIVSQADLQISVSDFHSPSALHSADEF